MKTISDRIDDLKDQQNNDFFCNGTQDDGQEKQEEFLEIMNDYFNDLGEASFMEVLSDFGYYDRRDVQHKDYFIIKQAMRIKYYKLQKWGTKKND